MAECTLSDTYITFFNHIIGPYLTQIISKYPDYCLRSRNIPREIGYAYEEYKENAISHMKKLKNTEKPKLDRHKLASCICGAIIKAQPISYLLKKQIPNGVNEILALHVALGVIKYFMIYEIVHKIPAFEERQAVKSYLVENFCIILPTKDTNICDTQEYEQNLYNALLWSHDRCDKTGDGNFHYDIWAYATIFYHIESFNRSRLNEIYQEYLNHANAAAS